MRRPAPLQLALLLAVIGGFATAAQADSPIDKVLVEKSQMRLSLMSRGRAVRSFPIYLGGNPVGHKQYQGDLRTPEGRYVLHRRNAQSRFYRSLRLDYPNAADRDRARRLGKSPGGDIMIHGLPELEKRSLLMFAGRYWTDGCIALSNAHMQEVWELVELQTPIEIRP